MKFVLFGKLDKVDCSNSAHLNTVGIVSQSIVDLNSLSFLNCLSRSWLSSAFIDLMALTAFSSFSDEVSSSVDFSVDSRDESARKALNIVGFPFLDWLVTEFNGDIDVEGLDADAVEVL